MTIDDYIARLPHYEALGQTRVVLRDVDEPPWELATGISVAGAHRFDITTWIEVQYAQPSGVTFVWFFEIEERGSNGAAGYRIDVERVVKAGDRLTGAAREQFINYLAESAESVDEQGRDYLNLARRQFGDAGALRAVVAELSADGGEA